MNNEEPKQPAQSNENTLPGGVTQGQVDAWKEKYKKVRFVRVAKAPMDYDPTVMADGEITGDYLTGYYREPGDREKNYAFRLFGKPLEAGASLLKACWLGGDRDILTNTTMLNSVAMEMLSFLELHQVKMGEL